MNIAPTSPAQALHLLLEGNRRFKAGSVLHPHQSVGRRLELLAGQRPLAAVLACSDSRVSPEIVFDQGLGDLFVIRNAGNVVDPVVLGSLEYAVEHLGCELIVVLGHTGCGALTAAVAGKPAGNHVDNLLEILHPAVEIGRQQPGDPLLAAIVANVRQMARLLRDSQPTLQPLCAAGRLKVTGAVYHLDSAEVELVAE